jgi:predicted nucleic acid-binding protein
MTYWDTSCVLKLYAPEADSAAYIAFAARFGPLRTSDLTKTELFYGLIRKEAAGDIADGMAEMAFAKFADDERKGRFVFYPLGEDVRAEAEKVAHSCYRVADDPVAIRTLDGLHLATAVVAKLREVVTADERMLRALPLVGLCERKP